MGVGEASINNIMGGIENTGVRLHNHRRKLKQRFDIIKKLGQGTYGKVQLGINKETGQEVAIKTIKKSKIDSEADLIRIRREIQIMSSVQHPNIIHIYEVFENREKMVLVMEYAAGGELYDYLSERKVLAEEEARRIFRQIATACYYCHKHKICHRDLKLENILLDENSNAKIADFGLSNVFDDQRLLNTFCGSPLYASPEIVRGTPYHGPEVDCWSLGVLLYTLVYGAMPFDGSNFKRLVRQISNGDYFEPQKPSPASPLIKEMLRVNPIDRANIEQICAHWWVNEGYDESCLDISEDLANQTPVRLDLLLSLAPPPPQLESDKLVVAGEMAEDTVKAESMVPTRSQSVGSLMELTHPAERRIKELINEDKIGPKRKLESTVSTDHVNLAGEGLKRRDKIIKENTVADITVHGTIHENASMEDASMSEASPLEKSSTRTISRDMDVEENVDPALQGAACVEIIEESAKKETKKAVKVKKSPTAAKEEPKKVDKENEVKKTTAEEKVEEKPADAAKPTVNKKIVKKKVLADKNENIGAKAKEEAASKQKEAEAKPAEAEKVKEQPPSESKENKVEEEPEQPSKPVERRRSKIFETAEKFQNMISSSDSKTAVAEKPKKLVIPGVSVGGYKKEYERKASLTSTSPPKVKAPPVKKTIIDQKSVDKEPEKDVDVETNERQNGEQPTEENGEIQKEKVKNAVNIISSVLDKEGTRKSKSRPCMYRKPPVPFGASGRSASGSIGMIPTPLSPTGDDKRSFKLQIGPNETRTAHVEVSTPEHTRYITQPFKPEEENKTSSAEITLKSATLPRRKTTKAEIRLDYPVPKPATMEFKTEMAHRVEAAPKLATQRSEVTFPVSAPPNVDFRASSLEPGAKASPKERIIPISFEKGGNQEKKEAVASPPVKPPMPRVFQTQKSSQSQRSNSLSRQSTQESDSETTTSTGEPIRKSPREFIIPIAVEGGGYVTPRAGSLEPSESASTASTMTNRSVKFGRARRMNSLFNDREGSEDESPFATLHRHSSFGRDSDNEDGKKDAFHMHRLRSSRPRKATLEHNDSLSSGEDDDDDGFEIVTAENLFSTLLARVRDLTQRLNVEDGGRPGFPSSRLLSHFDHGTNFWNFNRMDPLSRTSPITRAINRDRNNSGKTSVSGSFTTPWRRSVSRDLASDIESVFKESTPTQTATLPRGDENAAMENLNLSDLDLKKLKLSDEDALALSYLTPGLSKRIQKQLLAQLAPSEARKLSRTLSMRNHTDKDKETSRESSVSRRSVDRLSSTLPRRFSAESNMQKYRKYELPKTEEITSDSTSISLPKIEEPIQRAEREVKSFLPVKYRSRDQYSPYKESQSSYYGNESDTDTKSDNYLSDPYRRSRATRSVSLREPRMDYRNSRSPESSLSESLLKDTSSLSDNTSKRYSSDLSPVRYSAYSPDSSSLTKYLSPIKNYDLPRSYIPNVPSVLDTDKKTEIRRPSTTTNKRVSRFLRPDFYDTPKEENVYLKEKKEREMETQKVLKEIRDKRIKNRLSMRRDRSASRDNQNNELSKEILEHNDNVLNNNPISVSETDAILKTVSDNIKKLESSVKDNIHDYVNLKDGKSPELLHDYVNVIDNTNTPKEIHDYVNVKSPETVPVVKKERVSKLIRPKSYPTESTLKERTVLEPVPEKETKSRIGRLKKGFSAQKKDKKEETPPKEDPESNGKNKFLHSIEKKFTKLRSLSNTPTSEDAEEKKVMLEKKSSVENAIKRLREQSLPRNLDHITESGLIKRAVSVEDMTTGCNPKALQASRKSVSKILGLFKKYEERDKKKNEKSDKSKKIKENGEQNDDSKKNGANPVISTRKSSSPKENGDKKKTEKVVKKKENGVKKESKVNNTTSSKDETISDVEKKPERPRSLLFDRVRQFQNTYTGAKSDSIINGNETKPKQSRLPVNSFRHSLNLENAKISENKDNLLNNNISPEITPDECNNKPDRRSLKLDFTKVPSREPKIIVQSVPGTSSETPHESNRNSLVTTDDSSFLSPGDDNDMSCDSWSVSSDYHHHDLTSPVSPNGFVYSGDEGESVIDRIRRKSFYSRFNEKKKPKRSSYKDLDLYKDLNSRKSSYRAPVEYGSLDRKFTNYRNKGDDSLPLDGNKRDYKSYGRASSVLNDNFTNRYQTYNPRRVSSIYSDSEDANALDDDVSAGKSTKYSTLTQPSRYNRNSVSPVSSEQSNYNLSSSLSHAFSSPTPQSPV